MHRPSGEGWVNAVLARFRVKGGGPKRWDAFCSAHEDNKPSLSIRVSDSGMLMIRCMAPCSCDTQSVLTAVGLTMQDLFPPDRRKYKREPMSKPTFVAAYDYRDEEGNLKYQVLRWEPKNFNQRRPNPQFDKTKAAHRENNPEWKYNMEGVKRILFKLPELIADLKSKPDGLVFILEGEKSVLLAREHGMIATCNTGGALKWNEEAIECAVPLLTGRKVVVIADNDPVDSTYGFSPGMRHAEEVCGSLKGKAESVKLVVMPGAPPKGDYDEFVARRTKEKKLVKDIKSELWALIKATPEWERSAGHATNPTATSPPAPEPDSPEGPDAPDSPEVKPADKPPEPEKKPGKAPEPEKKPAAKEDRKSIPIADIVATVTQRVQHLQVRNPNGPHSVAELVGSLEGSMTGLKFELFRLPKDADADIVNDVLVSIAATCVEYLVCGHASVPEKSAG